MARPAAVLAMMVLLGACGASPSGVPADFATRALAVCDKAFQLKEALGPFPVADFNPTRPDVTKFSEVASALRNTATIWETWLSDLEALGEPSTGREAWADLVAGVRSHRDLNADQIAAAERGDAETFASDYHAGVQAQADVLQAATAAGVAACARVDR